MTRRLDWDRVGREDRVRRHGSVSVYEGMPGRGPAKTKPWKTKTGIRYAEKLRPQLNAVFDELKRVPRGSSVPPGFRLSDD